MDDCNSLTYRAATTSDSETLAMFVNNSYCGEIARRGWTNANDLIDGERTNANLLNEMINSSESIVLMFFNELNKVLTGCVHLQHQSKIKTAYLGMLTVHPDLQRQGYGKRILSIAENYVIDKWNVDAIEMTVIVQSTELIEFYHRHGYIDTGKHQPFPPFEFGRLKRNDLQVCTLQKCVKTNDQHDYSLEILSI